MSSLPQESVYGHLFLLIQVLTDVEAFYVLDSHGENVRPVGTSSVASERGHGAVGAGVVLREVVSIVCPDLLEVLQQGMVAGLSRVGLVDQHVQVLFQQVPQVTLQTVQFLLQHVTADLALDHVGPIQTVETVDSQDSSLTKHCLLVLLVDPVEAEVVDLVSQEGEEGVDALFLVVLVVVEVEVPDVLGVVVVLLQHLHQSGRQSGLNLSARLHQVQHDHVFVLSHYALQMAVEGVGCAGGVFRDLDGLVGQAGLAPEERHTAPDGQEREQVTHVLGNALRLDVVGHVALLVDASGVEAGASLSPGLATDESVDEFLAIEVDLELVDEALDERDGPLGVAGIEGGEQEVVVEEVVSPGATLAVLGQVVSVGEVMAPTQDTLHRGDRALYLLVVRVALHLCLAVVAGHEADTLEHEDVMTVQGRNQHHLFGQQQEGHLVDHQDPQEHRELARVVRRRWHSLVEVRFRDIETRFLDDQFGGDLGRFELGFDDQLVGVVVQTDSLDVQHFVTHTVIHFICLYGDSFIDSTPIDLGNDETRQEQLYWPSLFYT